MELDEEAQEILKRVKADNFFLRVHASQRMKDRRIERAQIIHCAATCFHWRWQEDHGSHLFLGFLVEGVSGGFSAVLAGDAIVVTVFKRRLTQWERDIVKSKGRSRA
jgi:hypothetical protein